ncbi:MAG: mechanosensitive ion channel family protein [Bacteroidaceae bacterium]|nr:mechanosensitive ion channel family protein [Bacteroidaceae bacterium]
MRWAYALIFLLALSSPDVTAQNITGLAPEEEEAVENKSNIVDAQKDLRDSIIDSLNAALREAGMRELLLAENLEAHGMAAREDSIRLQHRKEKIQALKATTPGVPLIVDKDTLLLLYANDGGETAEVRTADAARKIQSLGRRLTFSADSVHVLQSEFSCDIMMDDVVILSITELDGVWESKDFKVLANEYAATIAEKIGEIHDEYGAWAKTRGFLLAALIIFIQYVLIRFTNHLYRLALKRIAWHEQNTFKPIAIKNYDLLSPARQGRILGFFTNMARWLLIIIQLIISVPLIFTIFPETKQLANTFFSYLVSPLRDIGMGILGFVPNLIKIIIICLVIKYVLRGVRFIADEIEAERLQLTGFYPDWARPTYLLIRTLGWCFGVVMIWPLLPSSDSEEFKGVSVFIGLVVSIGSTSIVGNLVAGMVMTYMRPFRVGDTIEVNGVRGAIIEKTPLIIRIRTPKNDVVTIPNQSVLTNNVTNFTTSTQDRGGVIIHTEVTIGYGEPREKICDLLTKAALNVSEQMVALPDGNQVPLLAKEPKPFVLITALEDFYVRYQINAYTLAYNHLPLAYSELHKQILDTFFAAGVEIMSPHFFAKRNGEDIQMPPSGAQA